jgi:glycosyltransferase involved in cell wall biosynthesis
MIVTMTAEHCNAGFIVAQMGARMHYAVPRILHGAGYLSHLFTDICSSKGWTRMVSVLPPRILPGTVRRLRDRDPRGVPAGIITAFEGLGWQYARRRARARTVAERAGIHVWAGEEFGRRVCGERWPAAQGVYVFNSAALEILRRARDAGLRAILEQTIAPRAVEQRLLNRERARWPGWEEAGSDNGAVAAFCEREEQEWRMADRILCASAFVIDGIRERGGPAERCVRVPYGVDPERFGSRRPIRAGPLRVLTVGAVGLRKGAPYILEAAERLQRQAVFRLVGPVQVSHGAATELSRHVELAGSVPPSGIREHYRWADVFLLPSVCEGSATVTYEALAAGLPVICTPNTGSVVTDGVDGIVIPAGDSGRIVEAIEHLVSNPERRAAMAEAARMTATGYSLASYGARLLKALGLSDGTVVVGGEEAPATEVT